MAPRSPRAALVVALLTLVAAGVAAPSTAVASSTAKMRAAINDARADHGLRPLRNSPKLKRGASSHVQTLAAESVLQHATRIWTPGFDLVGEILAWAPRATGNRAIVRAWLASPTHRTVMLRPSYRFIGIARARGRTNGVAAYYWVVRFGQR